MYLCMSLNKRGRGSLVGTPFANEVEKGFTFSQITSSILSGAKHLISFSSRSGRRRPTTESDFTNSNGFTASDFTIVNGPPAVDSTDKGHELPIITPHPPLNLPKPPLAKTSADKVSVSATVARPTSPFSRPAIFHPITRGGRSETAGGINVVTSTHKYEDSFEDAELAEVVKAYTKGTPHSWDSATPADISVSDALSGEGSIASSVGGGLTTKAKEGKEPLHHALR